MASHPSREQWERRVSGEFCPLCDDLPARLRPGYADNYGQTIAELSMGVFRLCADQFSPGYSVVICTRHVIEPYELPPAELAAYLADVMRAARAVQQATGADKMNYLFLGNEHPHSHCHLVPRYHGDPAWGQPYLPAQPVRVPSDVLAERVERIRAAL